MATNYFQQITALLEHHDLVRSLKTQRSQLIKGINAIGEKMRKLEDKCFDQTKPLYQQIEPLNLPVEIFDEIDTSQEQLEFLSSLAKEDDYLSELYLEYESELIAVEEELFNLKNQPLLVALVAA